MDNMDNEVYVAMKGDELEGMVRNEVVGDNDLENIAQHVGDFIRDGYEVRLMSWDDFRVILKADLEKREADEVGRQDQLEYHEEPDGSLSI